MLGWVVTFLIVAESKDRIQGLDNSDEDDEGPGTLTDARKQIIQNAAILSLAPIIFDGTFVGPSNGLLNWPPPAVEFPAGNQPNGTSRFCFSDTSTVAPWSSSGTPH